jgi:hypothetical protein
MGLGIQEPAETNGGKLQAASAGKIPGPAGPSWKNSFWSLRVPVKTAMSLVGIRLLRRSGFEVEDLIEIRPEAGAISRDPFVTVEWARKWPCEEVWKARKTQ